MSKRAMESTETVIIGGGQAGLSTSYYLQQAGREHLVLERADRVADAWRSGRWDSFTLVTPNWAFRLPGAQYDGADPEAFMEREEVLTRFDRYLERYALPVRTRTKVTAVERDDGGFRVSTPDGALRAQHVVIATGWEQLPKVPPAGARTSTDILQLHSSAYRNPDALPPGAVLVVGSAQSGAQIAEELCHRGRDVYLSIGATGRMPRRYRGKDAFDWILNGIKLFDIPRDRFPVPAEHFTPPHVSGAKGGHTLNLHQFAREGMHLLGHLRGIDGAIARFEPDLHRCLVASDAFETQVTKMIDRCILDHGFEAPLEALPHLDDGFAQPVVEQIDLAAEGIGTVIWATGYRRDFGMVKFPVLGGNGWPIQKLGTTAVPGLYFVGMPWMPGIKPVTLAGVGEHAAYIAGQITARHA